VFTDVREAEHVEYDLSINHSTVVMVEVRLYRWLEPRPQQKISTHLGPLPVRAVQSLDKLWIVEIQGVRSKANHRTIQFMELLDLEVVAATAHHKEAPKIRPFSSVISQSGQRCEVQYSLASTGPGYCLRGDVR